jgi:hypothetical protein
MCFEPNHLVEDHIFDSSVLPPYSLHQSNAPFLSMMLYPAPFLSMMLQLSPMTLLIIRVMLPLLSPKVMNMMTMIYPHLIMLFPLPIQTPETLLMWRLARYIPKMSMDFGVEHAIKIITSSMIANGIQPNLNILYIRCALMILTHG